MGLLDEATLALRAVQAEWMDEEIVYRRSGGVDYEIHATVGKTIFKSRNDYGEWLRTETRDFIVRRGELTGEPAKGDEILYQGETYEVLAPNDEPVWRWSDPHRTAYRIHTKHTGEAT